jgi:hypothetical protein
MTCDYLKQKRIFRPQKKWQLILSCIKKTTIVGFVFAFSNILVIAPLFHLHVGQDHEHVSGKTYHSHSLPENHDHPEDEETELPPIDEIQFLYQALFFSRDRSLDSDNQTYYEIFSFLDVPDLLQDQEFSSFKHICSIPLNSASPQWDNFIDFATNLSPPIELAV